MERAGAQARAAQGERPELEYDVDESVNDVSTVFESVSRFESDSLATEAEGEEADDDDEWTQWLEEEPELMDDDKLDG